MKPLAQWRYTGGPCFGLQQRALIGELEVGPADTHRLRRIEAGLRQRFTAPVAEGAPPAAGGAQAHCAWLFAFAHGAVQRESRVAVSERFHVRALKPLAPGTARFEVALPAPELDAAKIALNWVRETFAQLAARAEDADQADAAREAIHERLRHFARPGLNTFNILMAAHRADIPVQHVTRTLMLLGTGARARAMESTITDATPFIGVSLAQHKDVTAMVLRNAGLPGGVNVPVASADDAADAAARLGYPVVVKPADRDQGVGVSADLRDAAAVREAYAVAREASPNVLVERWAPGFTHRLTVFEGRVIRIARRVAGGVFGDGHSTVAELVERAQQDEAHQRSRRRLGRTLLTLDDEALGLLRQNGLAASHVPRAGEYVRLRRRDNVSAGGSNEPVRLDAAHPDNLHLAIDAAALLGLDFAGVDLIIEDIARSWFDIGALVCEVNAQPQMGDRSEPGIYERVLRDLVGEDCRIPARLAVCPDDEARSRGLVEDAVRARRGAGISSREGLWIGGRRATRPFELGIEAATALLRRKDVASATCFMTLAELARYGLPTDRWDDIDFSAVAGERGELLARVEKMVAAHRAMNTAAVREEIS
ncbi:hypothetical protein [Ramlibacter sp.]|uniref:ATP-binding protein n=1 Tax=Ramlibacter sp. TaxID=1917967 RepID=UPI002D7EAFEC|nr:hypothetical protein [Ramlibacter sp.]